MQAQSSGFCSHCEKKVLAVKDKVNHVLHLILSLCTIGLWSWIWLILWIVNLCKSYRCTKCGSPV